MRPTPERPADAPDSVGAVTQNRAPWRFIALSFLLSTPFLLIAATAKLELLARLPVAALLAVCRMVAALFHAMQNLTWHLFPVQGSYYDPRVTRRVMLFIGVAVACLWGPRTLAGRGSHRAQARP